MGEYKKPLVTIDAGLAEGVYAASGAVNTVQLSDLKVFNSWGEGGQLTFTADLSGADPSQLVLVVTFNQEIANAWGGGTNVTVSGKTTMTAEWYSAPTSAEFTVQVSAGISTLKIESFSYYNK